MPASRIGVILFLLAGPSFDHFAQLNLPVTGSTGLPPAPSSPRSGEWVYRMLETSTTVEEALAFLARFDLWFFETFDAAGGEFSEGFDQKEGGAGSSARG